VNDASSPDHTPLSPTVFHTLLCLVDGEMHGYAIAQTVEERTGGAVKMGPGTLYGALHRLCDTGYIEECGGPEGGSERRRYYRLTDAGRVVLEADGARLAGDVKLLRAKGVIR
jgi:DNA-binding PadR family transcriptional regulator